MRKNIVFGATGLGIAAAILAAPVANAGNIQLSFDHTSVVPGQSIKGQAVCFVTPFTTAPLTSPALEGQPRLDQRTGRTQLSGTVKVKKDIKPGTYPVTFTCGDYGPVTTNLTVVAQGDPKAPVKPIDKPVAKPTEQPKPAQPAGQVAVKPKGAADTGEGDVQVTAAPVQQSSGPGTGVFVIGGAALLAAAGGAFTIRKLRKQG